MSIAPEPRMSPCHRCGYYFCECPTPETFTPVTRGRPDTQPAGPTACAHATVVMETATYRQCLDCGAYEPGTPSYELHGPVWRVRCLVENLDALVRVIDTLAQPGECDVTSLGLTVEQWQAVEMLGAKINRLAHRAAS